MEVREILPDPLVLMRLGVHRMIDAAVLVHLGRCGTCGATRAALTAATGGAIVAAVGRLKKLRLVTDLGRSNGQGRHFRHVVTRLGWRVLTTPADLSAFPVVQEILQITK
jgi:hypothetical protein